MHMDRCSPLLCEHSVPVIWCFYIFTLVSFTVIADYLHYEAPVNPLSLQDHMNGARDFKPKMRNVKNNMWVRCHIQIWLGSLVN